MWIFAGWCILAVLANAENSLAGEEWKALSVTVIDKDGQRRVASIYDFVRKHGEQGRRLGDTLRDATQGLPENTRPRFVRGLALPGIVIESLDFPGLGLPSLLEGKREPRTMKIRRVPRGEWRIHPDNRELFDAELTYLRAYVASEALAFANNPPLADEEQTRLSKQLAEVQAALKVGCKNAGFDLVQVESVLKGLSIVYEESSRPERYGAVLRSLPDDELDQLLATIKRSFEATKVPEANQRLFVERQGMKAIRCFQSIHEISKSGPGSKRDRLAKARVEAIERKRQLEKQLPTTRPVSGPSTCPSSS